MNTLVRNVFGKVNSLPHGYQIAGCATFGGAVFMASYGLSVAGLLEAAASALVFFFFQLVALTGPSLSNRAPRAFKGSAAMLEQFLDDWKEWRKEQAMMAQAILAFAATCLFVVSRFVCASVLPLITNVWFAGALGLGVTAVVISPALARGVVATFKSSSQGAEDSDNV